MLAFVLLVADEAPKQPEGLGGLGALLPLLLIGVLFYFMMIRPMRRQEKERQAMAGNLQKNDKVLTASGIYGTVHSVSDTEDEVVVKVDDNARLRMTKGSIVRNLTQEAAQAAAKGQPAEPKKS
jgi:preprotein translocase subunit YajC